METVKAKRATIGFIISLIAGIIILVAGVWMYSMISALGSLSGSTFTGFLGAVGAIYGALGVIFGLAVIVGAVLIYMPRKEMIGAVLVLVFSLLSILTGGGFFIGLILGIIGGILGILKK